MTEEEKIKAIKELSESAEKIKEILNKNASSSSLNHEENRKFLIENMLLSHYGRIHLIVFSILIASPILLIWVNVNLWFKIFLSMFLLGLSQMIVHSLLRELLLSNKNYGSNK